MRLLTVTVSAFLISALAIGAEIPQPKAPGIESGNYVWNEMKDEALLVLRTKGDAKRGAITYKICHGCHKTGALGLVDGTYPRLAGQHDTVLIKELVDVRTGVRDNQKMYPFASEHGIELPEIADLAVYISGLPTPPDNGLGDGTQLAMGKKLYDADCKRCHGDTGEGDGKKFYPKVSGQHYQYLKRQVSNIRDGVRRNANPRMVKDIKNYTMQDIEAVSDYMSRLGRN